LSHSSKVVVYAALLGNVLVAATKMVAAALTGSSAMLSEGVHSLVDTGNELLLLYGMRRSETQPDREHPLGHGRELYFWSFVVALLVFAVGAGVSIYEGIMHIRQPEPIENVAINYVVLALSALFDGASWWVALRKFKASRPASGFFGAIRESKDPPSFIVLLEDSAALVGIAVATLGVVGSSLLHQPVLDGVASILIGVVLATTAVVLARETKGLLIGEKADPQIAASILRLAESIPGVAHANGIFTVHLAPSQIVVALSLEFADELRTPDIEGKVIELERRMRESHPDVVSLFVKPQTLRRYQEATIPGGT